MFLHFNQYFRMTPQEALEDDKRVRKNQIEALLLTSIFGSLILTSRTQVSPGDITKPNNGNAEIERVFEFADSDRKLILCTNSDDDLSKSSFFAEGIR